MENQSFDDAVLKTVMFWTEKSFKTLLNQNNGDDSEHGGMAFMLMNMNSMAAKESINDTKITAFEIALTEILNRERKDNPDRRIILDVDYHPNQLLAEAAEFAGIESGCFPCKSSTYISSNNEVTAYYQYGSKGEIL